jgi:hypothetical protein
MPKKGAFPNVSATIRLWCRLLVTHGASPILSGIPQAEGELLSSRKAEEKQPPEQEHEGTS